MRHVLALAGLLAAAPLAAQSMNAETFHARAMKLKAKGPLALLERGEIEALMREGQAAGRASGEQRKAAIAAGRRPRYCPPAEVNLGQNEFMAGLSAIPAAERRRITMTEAMNRILAARFPCRR